VIATAAWLFALGAAVWIVYWMRYGPIAQWVRGLWLSRQHAGETAGVPEDRHAWNSCADAVLLNHERRDTEETNQHAADIILWEAELGECPGVHKYMRRMDRWSL